MAYWCMKMISALVCALPPGWRRGVGGALGALTWPLVPRRRKRMAADNIMRSLQVTAAAAERIARASWVRFGPMLMEVLAFPAIKRRVDRYVRMEGTEYLDEALRDGRGAVIPTSHSGNWELLGCSLAMHGYPLVAVAQKQTSAAMDRFINEYRTLAGMHVTYKSSVREMVRLLSDGKIIGLLMDQDAGRDGIFVDFFGWPASVPGGAAFLARLKDAPIVPAFILYNGDGTHTVRLQPPLRVEKTADKAQDVRLMTEKLVKIMEAHIRRYPNEWFWLHNRWKTRPLAKGPDAPAEGGTADAE